MNTVSQPGKAKGRPRRRVTVLGVVLAAFLLWVLLLTVVVVKLARSFGLLGGDGTRPAVTISEETTYIVEPLREDGYVDYLAALNERSREGVTPENNAAVLLWQAIGPAEFLGSCGGQDHQWFFEELAVDPLPEKGEYFVGLDELAKRMEVSPRPAEGGQKPGTGPVEEKEDERDWQDILGELWEQCDQAKQRPWSIDEFPELAAWLESNEDPLRLFVEASRKERFYTPLVLHPESPYLICVLVPGRYKCRELCDALNMRAMLRLHQGRVEEAWQDLLACRRWARLAGQGPLLFQALGAVGIEEVACSGGAAVAHHGNLTSQQAERFQADLRRLGPLPSMADKINMGERFVFLDFVAAVAREGLAVLAAWGGSDEDEAWLKSRPARWVNRAMFEWDIVLRVGNEFYDRLVEVGRIADRSKRTQAMIDFDDEIDQRMERFRGPLSFSKELLLRRSWREGGAEMIGQVFTAAQMPALSVAFEAEDRAVMTLRMTEVALALAAYRAEHGVYPNSLSQLVPEYVDEAPTDLFTGGQLRYECSGRGYLLYSVGPNGEDDEGRTWESDPQGDDIVIRTGPEGPRD